jgi:hypothetical protein
MANDREITIKIAAKNLTAAEFSKARSEILGLGQASEQAGKSGAGMAGMFKTAAASMAGFLGGAAILGGLKAGFSAVVGGAIDMNAELERSTMQFTTLMGDSGKAEAHVKSLFDFAKKTPFETGPIIKASRMMQTFGGDALNTMDNLTLLGDAAAATGAPIDDLGFWVGRMYASLKGGQPFGESAMRLQELAVLTPAARAEMEALQKAGKSGEEVFAVFQGRLGEFSGAMVAQASSWDGLTSSISDAVNIMMADALKPLFDLVKVGAQVVLTALGSAGMEKAFTGLKDTIGGALGSDADGGVGVVKSFVSYLLTGVDLGLATLGLFGQGWGALKAIVYGVLTGMIGAIDGVVQGFALMASTAEKIPGVGDNFKGVSAQIRAAADFTGSLKLGFQDLTREAFESAKGNDAWGKTIAGARGVVQTMRSEIESATVSITANTAATKRAGDGKADYVAKTKAQEEAEKAHQKLIEKGKGLADEILLKERLRRISGEDLVKVIKAGNVELHNEIDSLGRVTISHFGVLQASNSLASGMMVGLKPAVTSTTAELTKLHNAGDSVGTSLSKVFRDLPKVIQGAMQGGGDLGKSVGALFGSQLFGEDSSLTKTVTGGISKLFSSEKIGKAIGSVIPGLGTMLGTFGGQLADKLFGGLFKSEGKKVNNARDEFTALNGGIDALAEKAAAAGLSLKRMYDAKTMAQLKAAMDEINAAVGQNAADHDLAREAMEEWGISAQEAGQKFAQADMDETAGRMLKMLKAATSQGVDLNAIVEKGGDDFGKMVRQAIRTGTTISDEFKPVIAAMIANKTLVDENGVAFEDLSEVPFGTTITGAVEDVAAALRELKDFFLNGVTGAFGVAAGAGEDFARRVYAGVTRIPTKIDIEVNGRYNPPDIEGGSPGYAIGTLGRHGAYFTNFGAGTDVRVHGHEAILTPAQAPGFVEAFLRANGGGSTGGSMPPAPAPNVYILVEDGKPSAISQTEFDRRKVNAMLRGGLLQVPSRAVGGAV